MWWCMTQWQIFFCINQIMLWCGDSGQVKWKNNMVMWWYGGMVQSWWHILRSYIHYFTVTMYKSQHIELFHSLIFFLHYLCFVSSTKLNWIQMCVAVKLKVHWEIKGPVTPIKHCSQCQSLVLFLDLYLRGIWTPLPLVFLVKNYCFLMPMGCRTEFWMQLLKEDFHYQSSCRNCTFLGPFSLDTQTKLSLLCNVYANYSRRHGEIPAMWSSEPVNHIERQKIIQYQWCWESQMVTIMLILLQ